MTNLEKYGHHLSWCHYNMGHDCNCGFEEALLVGRPESPKCPSIFVDPPNGWGGVGCNGSPGHSGDHTYGSLRWINLDDIAEDNE